MSNKQDVQYEKIKYSQMFLHYEVYNLKTKRTRETYDENAGWHWHDDIELCLVKDGKAVYKIASKEFLVEKGDIVYVNPNTIHSVLPSYKSDYNMMFISVHLFDSNFVCGGAGNSIDANYVSPIVNNKNIDIIIIKSTDEHAKKITELIEENNRLKMENPEFWEFDLKSNIFKIWKIIYYMAEGCYEKNVISELYYGRLKNALNFIQNNYSKKITLDEIASAAKISSRECNRMFRKYLNMSPISYLLSVRLSNSVHLLCKTDKPIYEIALDCGYTGSSQFSKYFRETYDLTPTEYRLYFKKEDKN